MARGLQSNTYLWVFLLKKSIVFGQLILQALTAIVDDTSLPSDTLLPKYVQPAIVIGRQLATDHLAAPLCTAFAFPGPFATGDVKSALQLRLIYLAVNLVTFVTSSNETCQSVAWMDLMDQSPPQ
jgi:hypothetical protein